MVNLLQSNYQEILRNLSLVKNMVKYFGKEATQIVYDNDKLKSIRNNIIKHRHLSIFNFQRKSCERLHYVIR